MKPVKQSTMNSQSRDCKKQWNLDKQREKKKSLQKKHWLKKQLKPVRLQKSHTKSARRRRRKNFCRTSCPAKEKKKRPVSPENTEKRTASSANPEVPTHPKKKMSNPAAEGERPVRKPRPKTEGSSEEQPSRPHQRNALLLQTVHFSNMQKVRKKAGEKVRPRPKKNVRKKPNRYMQLTIPAHVSFLMKRMNLKLLHLIFPLQREKRTDLF